MAQRTWLVKQEPETYSWTTFLKEGGTAWTGVRNYQARIHLRAMKKGDPVFYYHSVSEKQVVGIARVAREAYPDPTADAGEGEWVCVDLAPVRPLPKPVPLDAIKTDTVLREMQLVRNSRLSVMPVTERQAARLLQLAGAA